MYFLIQARGNSEENRGLNLKRNDVVVWLWAAWSEGRDTVNTDI